MSDLTLTNTYDVTAHERMSDDAAMLTDERETLYMMCNVMLSSKHVLSLKRYEIDAISRLRARVEYALEH